jgi:23S rRNA (uracil1939-C5)-methyltransferase
LYLRHSIVTNQVMVCLVCNGRKLPHAKDFCSALVQAHPQISGIVLNVNTRQTNVITGDECITLYGSSLLQDEMSGVPVALGPLSFYQVNTLGANQLYAAARRMAALNPQDVLLDLYCGAGTIGLSMAADCKQLIGVEIVPQAIESARRNAARMGVSHAQFICADAGQAARQLAKEGLRPDVIVLDPPRKGCDHPTLQAVLQMAPRRIVMVSCNPATAARDAQYLSAQGYPVTAIQPVDMFPRTKHVETVALLSRS